MQREPSLHITESKLRGILLKILPDTYNDYEDLATDILIEARRVSCDNRIVTISNQKMERDIKKIVSSGKGDTNLMGTILFSIRKKLKHKGIQRIKEGSKDWKKVKELSKVVCDFCNDFELGKRAGFIIYVELGFKKISSYRNYMDKLINMYEVISLSYEAHLVIQDDTDKDETLSIHNMYVGIISKATGITHSFVDEPINYVNFVEVRNITDKYNVPTQVYLEAQFEGLQWTEGYPTPAQLISEKAIDRLNRFMFKNKIKIVVEQEVSDSNDLLSRLKKIKDGNYSD